MALRRFINGTVQRNHETNWLVLLAVIGIVLIVAFGGAFLIIFGSFILFFLIAWMFGIPVTIKEKGVKVGYVRWFTFHRRY